MRKLIAAAGGVAAVLALTIAPSSAMATQQDQVVKISVAGETYQVRLTNQKNIDDALRNLNGDPTAPRIPNGRIVRGSTDINTGWSWHIDPEDFSFADVTMELCDGHPSYVEDGSLTGDRYCPWHATVVSVTPAP
ncbi:hypothetical protein F0L68_31250 [Solihabitans fulvus]|uniref:BP74 N-terminal domain-containing protein n=1 Tax=Solihabitans fulvus TaxID=1892852 RepID=A0A5B2WUJ3_9PSEU|nr:hypothetical protein [Solihabitans fulvus]KAA2254089.1 hypothetical protein F0L68_31250 [Solihabitans fulvus]